MIAGSRQAINAFEGLMQISFCRFSIVSSVAHDMYVCRLLTRIKCTCYTIENKVRTMQMSRKKKERNIGIIHKQEAKLSLG